MTSSNENIFRVTGHLCGEFTGPRWIPAQRPVTRSFEVFFYLCLIKRLSKQWWGWWFETLSHPLWRHSNGFCTFITNWSRNRMSLVLQIAFLHSMSCMEILVSWFKFLFVLKVSIDNDSALVQKMAWRWTDGKPLSEPIMAQFTEACMRHSASMFNFTSFHYNDVIMSAMASQITSHTIVYSTVYSGTDDRKHQSSASLTFVTGIPRTKGQERGKCFHLMTSHAVEFLNKCSSFCITFSVF